MAKPAEKYTRSIISAIVELTERIDKADAPHERPREYHVKVWINARIERRRANAAKERAHERTDEHLLDAVHVKVHVRVGAKGHEQRER